MIDTRNMKKDTKRTAAGTEAAKGGKGATEKRESKPRKRYRNIPDRMEIDNDYGEGWYERFEYLEFPYEFYTPKAVELFKAACKADLLFYNDMGSDRYEPNREKGLRTKGMVAYFCKRASTYLGLDNSKGKGKKEGRTNWAPFEQYFNDRNKEPTKALRISLHNLINGPREDKEKIDAFFDKLEAPASDNADMIVETFISEWKKYRRADSVDDFIERWEKHKSKHK